MRFSALLLGVSMAGLLGGLLACGSGLSPVAKLRSPDARERRDGADALRDDGGPTPEGTQALLSAIKTETDDAAYGAMMISLGASGVPEAEPYICAKVYAENARMRTWAKKAHKLYLERNRSSAGCPPPGSSGAAPGPASAPAGSFSSTTAPAAAAGAGTPIGPTK